jgi:putative ABC transport system permease protein
MNWTALLAKTDLGHLWLVVLTVAILGAVAFGIVSALRLEKPYLQPIAILRALVQLAILSLILNGIISNGYWVVAFLIVMVVAATWVVVRRLELRLSFAPLIAGIILVASAVPVVILFSLHTVEFSPRYVLAVGGIVVGNAMTVSTLVGRSIAANLVSSHDEIEGWMALGATPRKSSLRVVQVAGSTALIPATDQTRTTGIVTLPGAFVGAIFAGASPVEAAEFQLLVLASILVAGAICVALMIAAFGATARFPVVGKLR